eukprot:GEZU01001222.1.p1 GENE.GEZU01001222.1~~GEZU01001222.1.p1  ORF type:complete len:159 (-),score=32.52 GEZU01001222.1:396-872(-)
MTMYPYNEPTSQQPQYYGPQSYAVPQQQQPIQPSYNPQYTLASQQAYPSQPPPQQQYAAPQPQLVVATTAYVPAVVAPSSTVVVTNTSTRKPKSEDTQAALTIFLVGLLLFFVSGAIPGIICWVIGGCFIISKGNAVSRSFQQYFNINNRAQHQSKLN